MLELAGVVAFDWKLTGVHPQKTQLLHPTRLLALLAVERMPGSHTLKRPKGLKESGAETRPDTKAEGDDGKDNDNDTLQAIETRAVACTLARLFRGPRAGQAWCSELGPALRQSMNLAWLEQFAFRGE
jgi:hypothetical protein